MYLTQANSKQQRVLSIARGVKASTTTERKHKNQIQNYHHLLLFFRHLSAEKWGAGCLCRNLRFLAIHSCQTASSLGAASDCLFFGLAPLRGWVCPILLASPLACLSACSSPSSSLAGTGGYNIKNSRHGLLPLLTRFSVRWAINLSLVESKSHNGGICNRSPPTV